MGKVKARLLGVVLLAGSCSATLAHRSVYEAARQSPAQAAEFGLSLLTFLLASTGILLMIHCDKLFRRMDDYDRELAPIGNRPLLPRLLEPITPAGRAFDTRHGAAMVQARHAIASARALRSASAVDPRAVRTWQTSSSPNAGRVALFAPEVRRTFEDLLAQGWMDALRALQPETTIYTFWDQLRHAYSRNAELRLDRLLLNKPAAARLRGGGVNTEV